MVCERDQSAVSDIAGESDEVLLPSIRSLDMTGGPIASDGGLDALFVENCGRIIGRVLLVALVAWPLTKFVLWIARSKKSRINRQN